MKVLAFGISLTLLEIVDGVNTGSSMKAKANITSTHWAGAYRIIKNGSFRGAQATIIIPKPLVGRKKSFKRYYGAASIVIDDNTDEGKVTNLQSGLSAGVFWQTGDCYSNGTCDSKSTYSLWYQWLAQAPIKLTPTYSIRSGSLIFVNITTEIDQQQGIYGATIIFSNGPPGVRHEKIKLTIPIQSSSIGTRVIWATEDSIFRHDLAPFAQYEAMFFENCSTITTPDSTELPAKLVRMVDSQDNTIVQAYWDTAPSSFYLINSEKIKSIEQG